MTYNYYTWDPGPCWHARSYGYVIEL